MAGRVGFEPTLHKAQINSLLTKPLVYRPMKTKMVRPARFELAMVVKRRLKRPLPSATRDMGAKSILYITLFIFGVYLLFGAEKEDWTLDINITNVVL